MTCQELGVHAIVWNGHPLCCEPFPRVYGVAENSSNKELGDNDGRSGQPRANAAVDPAPNPVSNRPRARLV